VNHVHGGHATIEVLLVALDAPARSRSLIHELEALRKRGILEVIDLVVVRRHADDSITSTGRSELSENDAREIRDFITDALGFHPGEKRPAAQARREGTAVLIGAEDVRVIAEMLRPGQAALAIVVEHLWASRLGTLIRGSGVTVLEDYMLSPGVLGPTGRGTGTW
jgi:hypothetical protein